jgi:hypothetical protein
MEFSSVWRVRFSTLLRLTFSLQPFTSIMWPNPLLTSPLSPSAIRWILIKSSIMSEQCPSVTAWVCYDTKTTASKYPRVWKGFAYNGCRITITRPHTIYTATLGTKRHTPPRKEVSSSTFSITPPQRFQLAREVDLRPYHILHTGTHSRVKPRFFFDSPTDQAGHQISRALTHTAQLGTSKFFWV